VAVADGTSPARRCNKNTALVDHQQQQQQQQQQQPMTMLLVTTQ